MEIFKDFVRWFLYITTIVLFVCAVNMELAGEDMVSVNVLWQILLSGIITSVVTVLLFQRKSSGKILMSVRIVFHYFILCIVMIGLGSRFGWMELNLPGIFMMIISVAAVYVLVFISRYIADRKQADEINRRLKEKYDRNK